MIKCNTEGCYNFTINENEKCIVCSEETLEEIKEDMENNRKFPELTMFQEIAILSFIEQMKESGHDFAGKPLTIYRNVLDSKYYVEGVE